MRRSEVGGRGREETKTIRGAPVPPVTFSQTLESFRLSIQQSNELLFPFHPCRHIVSFLIVSFRVFP
jgi:hypothetical protein